MKLVDIGRVVKVADFVSKRGEVFYLVVVDGVNSAWKVFSRKPFSVDDRVIVFEKANRIYVMLLDEWK